MDGKREYVLTGTVNDLADVLKNEFGFSSESSRLAALVLRKYNMDSTFDDPEKVLDYDAWYLQEEASFAVSIPFWGNEIVSVSLRQTSVDILKCLCDISVEYVVFGLTPDVTFVKDVILLLWHNIKAIPPQLRCVCFSALKWKKANRKRHFTSKDLVPDYVDNVCVYLEKTMEQGEERAGSNWVCSYRNGEECRLALAGKENNIEEIKVQLGELRDSGILKEYGEGVYDFKF